MAPRHRFTRQVRTDGAQDAARALAATARQTRDVLLRALAQVDPDTYEHTCEVTYLARITARSLGLDRAMREAVAQAAELHDIGKLAIPGSVLAKSGSLDVDELALMRRHTLIGEDILLAAPALRPVAAIVRASHERWDGRGYPDGLARDLIPLGARIVAVCDAYSAMRQRRPYGVVLSQAEALAELRRCSGTQFDPTVVAAFGRVHAAANAKAA